MGNVTLAGPRHSCSRSIRGKRLARRKAVAYAQASRSGTVRAVDMRLNIHPKQTFLSQIFVAASRCCLPRFAPRPSLSPVAGLPLLPSILGLWHGVAFLFHQRLPSLQLALEPSFYLPSAKTFSSSLSTASPTSLVEAEPPMSFVRMPESTVLRAASSTAFASAGKHKEYWSSMATERIAATGLTRPLPEISGADPGLR